MRSTLIRDARIFDGDAVLEKGSVLIEDGLISAVGASLIAPPTAEVIEGTGRTLLPGLIDSHTHVFEGDLEQALVFGVTTELDMLADPEVVARLKARAVSRADLADLRSAGWGATGPGGYPNQLVEWGYYRPFPTLGEPAEAVDFVAARVAEGSDYLKFFLEDGTTTGMPTHALPAACVRPFVGAAHEAGRLAIAHVLTAADAQLAIDARVDGLAHVFVDRPATPHLIEDLAAADIFVCPTLTAVESLCGRGEGARRLAGDPRIAPYLRPISKASLAWTPFPPSADAMCDFDAAMETVAAMRMAGVALLAGSDASNPATAHGVSLHRELELLVTAGLRETEALAAATSVPAERFGLFDRGRIAVGLQADLVLVEGNPMTDITVTRSIVAIWRQGARVDRAPAA